MARLRWPVYDGPSTMARLKKTMNTLSFRKSSILVSVTLIFFLLLLSSLGNTSALDIQQTDTTDTDKDGLIDTLETTLGTDVNNKYGDKDSDGLYDFEEYNDIYGRNDTTDQKYAYNNATSVIDGLGDLYHLFGLSSNKTGYLRDQTFADLNGGFTDYILWNVTFNAAGAGGSTTSNVAYSDNILMDVAFDAVRAGGTSGSHDVNYNNNTLTNVEFKQNYAGGTAGTGNIVYSNNTFTNVNFTGQFTGGSFGGDTKYINNTLTSVRFNGTYAGGMRGTGVVEYINNTLTEVAFIKQYAGGASMADVVANYFDNTFTNVSFAGESSGRSANGVTNYTGNIIVSDSYDNDSDGLGDVWEQIYYSISGVDPHTVAISSVLASDTDTDGLTLLKEAEAGTDPMSNDTDGDDLLDAWEVRYSAATGVDPLVAATGDELTSDMDMDTLNLMREFEENTDPGMSDTDSDGLPDAWEVRYSAVFGVNATDGANASELASDTDTDGLTLMEEFEENTDPTSDDTDNDGLPDGWEVEYSSVSGVNATDGASASDLTSDTDNDTLTLLQEAEAGTDPTSDDTDNDGLNDGWEVNYSSVSGVNATDGASASDLTSDTDNDTLTLLQEAEAGTNPASNDTDGDGLPDGWEVEYIAIPGVDPLVAADDSVLESDTDGDGQTLLEEAKANKDPETADNDPMPMPMPMNTTTTATTATTAADTMNTSASSSESSEEGSVTFLAVLTIFTLFTVSSLALVIYRMRRRML